VPVYDWIALGVFAIGLLIGGSWLAVNGQRFRKRGLPAARRLGAVSGELTWRTSELERRSAQLEPKIAELRRGSGRLSIALARARVQLDVVLEAKAMVDRLRFFVP
jgi:hypothetical protein